ncbi:LytR/AlgR family response regulator transcription factor [Niabella drilacis]|uniref:Two component transcriptional regulator, LytTR family n=1 Tax=Niabella drilacis (strain DSM 25811 / CCM 8410 / CCUG 62505 / LMG 26954 / E90) TaxID=1285928 RepID=A0A1G6LCU8_NIADE|nr:response regulator transcription factor [Niabella drilacis]SDC40605.1 two component transcriptional regulator, LytTR family [Niabella drilacis]
MKYKAFIVEDEARNRELLKSLAAEFCPEITVTGMAATVPEAILQIDEQKPDIVFMDIEMQPGTGFDVLQKVRHRNFQVIFTTAYDHYAIKAIKFSAIDYILKPIDLEELQQAVDKAVQAIRRQQENRIDLLMQNLSQPAGENFSISLSTADGIEYVQLSRIIRLEANGPYTTFFLKDQHKIMVSKNLKEYELLLSDHGFFRVHNSHIIHLREVRKMIKTDGGYAVMSDASMIAISPKKKDNFLQLMAQRLV